MSAIYFILMLGGLIFFHEFGHFIVARLFRVRVLEFSIGFGPQLGSFKRGDTIYRIGALPLGGYVKMLGADPLADPEEHQEEGSFATKPLWQRFLVVLAGPVFNLILPFIIFFFLFMTIDKVQPPVLGTLVPDGVAARAGLQPGDVIKSIDGEPVDAWWQLNRTIEANRGEPIDVVVERDGEDVGPIKLTPAVVEETVAQELGLKREVGRIQILSSYRRPIVDVAEGSAAWASGLRPWDRILSVGGKAQDRWEYTLRDLKKLKEPTRVTVLREKPLAGAAKALTAFELHTLATPVTVTFDPTAGDGTLGLKSAEFVVYDVAEGSPEWKAGIRRGDEILSINGRKVATWGMMLQEITDDPDRVHVIEVARDGETRQIKLDFEIRKHKGEFNMDMESVVFGFANRSEYSSPDLTENQHGLSYAVHKMWTESGHAFLVTASGLAGLFTGKVGFEQTGGPIFIYQAASKTEEAGWIYFFHLMAWLSISLGLINLIPIPLLDGGHLLFFTLEAVRRRPVSLRTRQIAAYVGFSVIILLMVMVFKNDIARSFFN